MNCEIPDDVAHQGVKALLACTEGEVEELDFRMYDIYKEDVVRVYRAMSRELAKRGVYGCPSNL